MKKVFLAFLFAASLGLVSCNNGVYDAQPAVNNSAAGNPLANGGVASKGQIVGTVNGTKRVFGTAYYLLSGSLLAMQGVQVVDNINHGITMSIDNYNGVGTYTMSGSAIKGIYTELNSNMEFREYNTSSTATPGYGSITVTDAGDEIKGTFTFTAYNFNFVPNTADIINGTFDLTKQ